MWPDGRGMVPYPAPLPLLPNSTVYNSGGNPQMPFPLPQNPTVYNLGGNPQMPLPLPQNSTVYNLGGNPQMLLPLLQNSTVYNPGGSPQVPLPFPQNFIVYNPGGNPQMPLPLLRNPTVYNSGGNPQLPLPLLWNSAFYNPEVQNQQGTIFPNDVSYAPYPDQARPASYSQQGRGIPVAQDQMAGDQNWHRNRRESRPLEYQNGEVVMVRCNRQKWLYGLIQRMSVQGLRIWIADADILVNVPLVLVPTHVLKMSMLPELQGVPPPEPAWTMSFTDENGCRKSLVQCVRPAHLSHRQLFHKFGCTECAICKTTVTSIDVVSPWDCSHQVHDYCLQLRMQHTSTSVCPTCEPPSPDDDDTFELVPSAFAGMGSQLPSTSPSNEHPQQSLDLQCACGFRGSKDSACIGNTNAPVFCPNCHQPVNVNQSGDLPGAYSDLVREVLQRKCVTEQGFGWDTFQSFSGPSRLEAIEEGSREGICSTPPTPDQRDEERADPASYMPSYLAAFGETFETIIDADPDVANTQPSTSFSSSLLEDMLTALSPIQVTSGKSSARSFLQDGVPTEPSPPQVTKEKSSVRISSQEDVLTAPSPPQVTLNQKEKSRTRISFQGDMLTAPSPTQDTLDEQDSSARNSLQDASLQAPSSSRSTLIRDDYSANDAQARPEEFQIGSPASTHLNQVTIPEADESSVRVLEAETPSLSAPHRQKLFRRASEVDWMTGELDEEMEASEEASSSNDFAAIAPSTPPVYVNHFENFVKLAMASASTAKEILASAAASPSSSSTEVLPWKSPSPAWVSPAPAIPPAAFFSRSPEAVTPVRSFYSRPPALVTEPPALAPEPVTEGAIIAPARALFSRAAGMITEAPAWVTKVKDPSRSGDAAPAWITVIKDGVDSRKEDAKQWELDRLARRKEAEFF